MRFDSFERKTHLGDPMLHLGVVGHRAREPNRPLALHGLDGEIERPARERVIDVAEPEKRPREEAEDEWVDPGRSGGHHPGDVSIGNHGAFEDRVVAARGAHAEHIPRLLDSVALRLARHERVHDFRLRRIARVHPVDAQIRPDRAQAPERLASREPVAAVHAFGLRGRQQHRDVVAALRMAGREHLSARGLFEQPRERRVAGAPEVGGDARPVEVHVDGERRGGRMVRETTLFADDLGQCQAEPAQFRRDREAQVARLAQLLEVIRKEGVLLVVAPGPRLEAGQQLVGQERLMGAGCLRPL